MAEKRSVLLHSCCGPCSTACIERLLPDYRVTVFFYNPNITEKEEYLRRRDAQIKFIQAYNEKLSEEDRIEFIEGEYLPDDFFEVCSGFSNEPEGGRRCTECFKLRMERTAQVAVKTGNVMFGTTLTVSPHKNAEIINAAGEKQGEAFGVKYLPNDFKKENGYKRSVEISTEYGLYRQHYCGCIYSKYASLPGLEEADESEGKK